VLAFLTLIWAARRGGEGLFVTGLMALVYLGYCIAVGIVYSMGPPYAYVAQLALLYFLPVFVAGALRFLQHPLAAAQPMPPGHILQKTAFWGLSVVLVAGTLALQIPSVKHYVFPQLPYQSGWTVYGYPNHSDNDKLVEGFLALPKDKQQKFLKLVHNVVAPSGVPRDDVSRYFAHVYSVMGYFSLGDPELKTLFTIQGIGTDARGALAAAFNSIAGLKASDISIIQLNDPDTWDGSTIHAKLVPVPERAGVDYQHLLTQKFNRYNYDVTWHGANEFTAHHRPWGCDALRYALAVFYGGYCPYDPRTGPNPYEAQYPGKPPPKNLTSGAKPAS
jgi:hypothetical protein